MLWVLLLANWLIPLILSWLYVLFAWIPGWIHFYGYVGGLTWAFDLQDETIDNWYTRAWAGWAGFGAMSVILLRDRPSQDERYGTTIAHEKRHSMQIWTLGLLQPILYITCSIFLFITAKMGMTPHIHPYLDNPFELDARHAAGQKVDIPPDEWPRGPKDHWPWW